MDTADNIHSTISFYEALERVGFEKLRGPLHTGRIPASHHALYTPEGTVRSGPGDTPLVWWAKAYKDPVGKDPVGRVFFISEWVENGCLIRETMFACTIDIYLEGAAFEMLFPAATGPAESGGTRAAQESIVEQNAKAATSASAAASPTAPQTEPVSQAPKSPPTPPTTAKDWFRKARKAHPQQPGEKTGDYAKRLERLMPQSEAGVTGPWETKTIIRRLQELRKAEAEAAAQKVRPDR